MDIRYKNSLPWGAQIARGNMLHALWHGGVGQISRAIFTVPAFVTYFLCVYGKNQRKNK